MIARIRNIVRGQRGGAILGVAGLLAAAAAAALVLALVAGDTSAPAADARGRVGDCQRLGLEQATEIYPVTDGSYGFSVYGVNHKVLLTIPSVENRTDAFDWQSTLGMDAVIVKTWFKKGVYTYDEAFKDTGLTLTKNKKAIFCFDTNDEPAPPTKTPVVATEEAPVATPEKCTNRKGCPTPEEFQQKCTDRKGCPTPTPGVIE